MFAPVWHAYRDQLLFAVALAALLAAGGLALVASDTWSGLLLPPLVALCPIAFWPRLRRFAGVLGLLLAGGLAVLAGGELLFRLRYFGPDAVRHFTGYTPLPPTSVPGLLVPSEDPEITYLFRPGASLVFNGKRWEINGEGFRDGAFAVAKAPGTRRILVLGDSFALGAGVGQEERFSEQLETELGGATEVYNLGLAGVTLDGLGHLLEVYGSRYGADLVLVAVRASQLHEAREREGEAVRNVVAGRTPRVAGFSFPRRYFFTLNIPRDTVRAGLGRVRAFLRPRAEKARAPEEKGEAAFDGLVRSCAAYSERTGVPVAVVALRKMEFRSDLGLRATLANRALGGDASRRADHEAIARVTARHGVPFIDTYDAFDPDARRSELIVFPGDGHPNAEGHRHYARAVAAWIAAEMP